MSGKSQLRPSPAASDVATDNTAQRQSSYGGRNMDLPQNLDIKNIGSAAATFDSKTPQQPFNILKDYCWTLSDRTNADNEIPYIVLTEHRNTEAAIMRMVKFYGGGAIDTTATALGDLGARLTENVTSEKSAKGILEVYNDIFPDKPTNLKYIFPYFSKSYFQLQTQPWNNLDGSAATQGAGDVAGGASKILTGLGKTNAAKQLDLASAIGGAALNVGETALKAMYPLVGVADRPRIFSGHSERSVTIEFPLYNTRHHEDWWKNQEFIHTFATQNLFNKRDFITGLPPVYYRVLVPNQYFSFASYVSDFSVENLGNVRIMYGSSDSEGVPSGYGYPVPDAFQVKITLTELLMPSLNQYQALISGDALKRVQVPSSNG